MATPVLIIGKSGSGKSTSLRNCQNEHWNLIRVLNKPLPFKGKIDGWFTDDYQQVMKCLIASKAESIVIDDAGYLITNHFMKGHASAGKGNAVFALYNDIGDYFWNLIQFIVTKVPQNKIVYLMMHEEKDDSGEVKPKTIGKLLDEKVCIEGMFTIVLRCIEVSISCTSGSIPITRQTIAPTRRNIAGQRLRVNRVLPEGLTSSRAMRMYC